MSSFFLSIVLPSNTNLFFLHLAKWPNLCSSLAFYSSTPRNVPPSSVPSNLSTLIPFSHLFPLSSSALPCPYHFTISQFQPLLTHSLVSSRSKPIMQIPNSKLLLILDCIHPPPLISFFLNLVFQQIYLYTPDLLCT